MSAKVAPIENDEYDSHSHQGPGFIDVPESDNSQGDMMRMQQTSTGKRRQTGLFATSDIDTFKTKVRESKQGPPPYNVHDRYYKTGVFQKIAKHWLFENFTLGVIVVNALWISIDTDLNDSDTINKAHWVFVLADTCFFTYFSIELFIRFCAFQRKCDCMKDPWFVFDTILVALYAFDPFVLGIMAEASGGGGVPFPTAVLRLFRLARLSRLVRMLRSLPQLMIMIKGMVTAIGTVGYAIFLLMIITYVFAIAFVNLLSEDNPLKAEPFDGGFFSGVFEAIMSLIVYATFLDNLADFLYAVQENSIICWILAWIYIILAALTVMNMLIGVLCNVIDAVAEEENEAMMVEKVHDKFGVIVRKMDVNNDGFLSWKEFEKLLHDPEAIEALDAVNVKVDSLIDVAEDFFFEDGEAVAVSFQEFMDMLLDLRESEQATVTHVFAMRKNVHAKFMKIYPRIDSLEAKLTLMANAVEQKFGR